jgi:hypothetical protein
MGGNDRSEDIVIDVSESDESKDSDEEIEEMEEGVNQDI